MIEFVLRQARVGRQESLVDIAFGGGLILDIAPHVDFDGPDEHVGGRLVFPGFVETHIHLDKAGLLERCPICEGTLAEAVRSVASAKRDFTTADVYARAREVLEKAIGHGTTRLRTFVEVDPRAGLRSFEALRQLKSDYAHLIDIELCVFAQEGLTQEMETLALMIEACRIGADAVGGCPYTDPDPARHVALIFDLAERFGLPVDFHIDFDLNPTGSAVPFVVLETRRRGFGGRVSIGHVTKLSALSPTELSRAAIGLAEAGIALTVLPATDMFLLGRDQDRLVPRGVAPAHRLSEQGVTATIATNNVMNPFTPYGDASLLRMANLFANVAQLSRDADLALAFEMVSGLGARLLGHDYGIAIGGPADLVLVDAQSPAEAVRTLAPVLAGWKRGRPSFRRAPVTLFR